ncbi:MAG: TSUP family transporter [Micavibrio sp.]
MIIFIIAVTAFFASLLTLFSGFGLGTILMPVAAIFFPVAAAVALTAFVHLVSNLFKLLLLWRHVSWNIVLGFGLAAMLAAIPGAWLLTALSTLPEIHSYKMGEIVAHMTPVKIIIGLLLIVFATMEWVPALKNMNVPARALPLGGLLSGFFGGLSGHQGAFRSAFLIRAGLDKNQFVASNAAIASMVDLTRLAVYGLNFSILLGAIDRDLLIVATFAALAGALAGVMGLKKMTVGFIQKFVAFALYLLGVILIAGFI